MKIIRGDFGQNKKPANTDGDNPELLKPGNNPDADSSYSIMLLNLVTPYLDSSSDQEDLEELVQIAIVAWNLANVKASGFPGFKDIWNTTVSAGGLEKEGLLIVEKMMQVKLKQFGDQTSFIGDYKLHENKKGLPGVQVFTQTVDEFLNDFEPDSAFDEDYDGELQYEEGYINRSAVIVKRKPAFLEWLERQGEAFAPSAGANENTIYLIPDFEEEKKAQAWIKKNFDRIFINELTDWLPNPERWPQKRTFKVFNSFFEWQFHGMVMDLEERPVIKD